VKQIILSTQLSSRIAITSLDALNHKLLGPRQCSKPYAKATSRSDKRKTCGKVSNRKMIVSTSEIDIAPATVGAAVALYGQSGGGTSFTGIKSYRRRNPDGTDQNIDFGDWTSWPPVIFDLVSSVVFATATVSDQEAWTIMRIDWWE
jgi:hypothetical protein